MSVGRNENADKAESKSVGAVESLALTEKGYYGGRLKKFLGQGRFWAWNFPGRRAGQGFHLDILGAICLLNEE